MQFETHTQGVRERRLRWAIGLSVLATLFLGVSELGYAQTAPDDDATTPDERGNQTMRQERDGETGDDLRRIRAREISVSFERLVIEERTVDDEPEVAVDYEIDRSTWRRLGQNDLELWMELRVPRHVEWRFRPFYFTSTVAVLDRRVGQVPIPGPETVDTDESVGVCLAAGGPGDAVQSGKGYFCSSLEWYRIRDDFSVDLDLGRTLRLRYQREPLISQYWYVPFF